MTKKQIKNKIQVSFYNFRKSHDPFITWEEIDDFYSFLGYELNMQNDLFKNWNKWHKRFIQLFK